MKRWLSNTTSRCTPYVPALGYGWLTRFYDPLAKWGLDDATLKRDLVRQSGLEPGFCVLDVGSGTGTLTLAMTESVAGLSVAGIDMDEEMVSKAARLTQSLKGSIQFMRGSACEMPFADASFDRVLSSLVFHHLTHQERVRTFEHIYRVLKPGGQLHFIDWTRPASTPAAAVFQIVRIVDGFERTGDSARGRLPPMLEHAGFSDVRVRRQQHTMLGTLAFFSATKSDSV